MDYEFTTIGTDELQRVNEGGVYVKMKSKHPARCRNQTRWPGHGSSWPT